MTEDMDVAMRDTRTPVYRLAFGKMSEGVYPPRLEWTEIFGLELPDREQLIVLASALLRQPGVIAVKIEEVLR